MARTLQDKYANALLANALSTKQRKTSEVLFIKIKQVPNGVQTAVKTALQPLWKKRLLRGKKIFVKVNLISSEFVPGQCTSPLVLDEVLKELTENGYDVTFGDADLAAARQCDTAAKVWGHKKLAEKYGARFQNLSKDKLVQVKLNGKIFKTLDVPECVLEADHILSLPVMKTHCLTGLTCSLKHFWGVVPRVRHQYHLVVDDAIADITSFLRPKLAYTIVDGTVCMEGDAPRTGKPKICNIIMASTDPVALDAVAARYMGLPTPKHVIAASQRGVGQLNYVLEGDEFEPNPFLLPNPDKQPIFYWEMTLRKSPLKPIIFDTSLFKIFSWIATKYNSFWYYNREGMRYTQEISKTWYGRELTKFINV
ncbi:MAG: DUF362 domain-containing protein [Candidatus Bathyarchaeia archaeon]|jgi:uncharacterized protein (DUF362 family)|nr:DUF362 domain-containing protein [Candidatus Bathyarchaeota archaeon A05DMB-4]MDH7595136.1 DUF362 domain-containing protein [Candidatus Bathyarchaeota archaeon]